MTAVATPERAKREELARPRTLSDRLSRAIPLLSVYAWLCLVYFWQAWSHVTPWLFTDELELTQLSRGIAATGHAARRGEPHSFDSLYTFLIAPAWWLHDTQVAYDAVKYIGVLAMTATVIPAYFLARQFLGPRASLFVAAATGAVPALAYSSMIVEESVAYPYSTLCLFLIAKALLTRRPGWIAAAAVASLVAPLVRGELAVIPVVFVFAALFVAWSGPARRRRRASWSTGDWTGFLLLVAGAVFAVSGFLSKHSPSWYAVTTYWKDRALDLGLWAAGSLAIGLGIVPVVAGLAMLWRTPGERPLREVRVFRSLTVAALIAFGIYTGVKAAYLSTVFATRTEERNLIYITPLLLIGTGLWLERRRVALVPLALATAFAAYLIVGTPFRMDIQLYSDALGVAILQQANRVIALTPGVAQWVLLALLVVFASLLAMPRRLAQRERLAAATPIVVACFVLAWSFTGELAAAAGSNSISRTARSTLRTPPTWVDDRTHGAPTLYLGQAVLDQNAEWLLEFWNRSIHWVWSVDGTAGGPGPSLTPDVHGIHGLLAPDPGAQYAVVDPGVDLAGKVVRWHAHKAGGRFRMWRLVKLDKPLRMLGTTEHIYPDGWSDQYDSAYTRYATLGKPGWVDVTVSRKEAVVDATSPVTIKIGTLRISKRHQPEIARVTQVVRWTVHTGEAQTFRLKAPAKRFRVRVFVKYKFNPKLIAPQVSSDARWLGAVVNYRFVPATPRPRR